MKESLQLQSRSFPEAGLFVMRSERLYLFASCQPVGVNGAGPHKHNDWLSFELCADNHSVIIDPGTYCYTGNKIMRNHFRSTFSHNTVSVDGQEQIPIQDQMFGLGKYRGKAQVLEWISGIDRDILEGEHTGYTRVELPVVHRRRFLFDKKENSVEITDTLFGKGSHLIEGYLHLNSGLSCENDAGKAIIRKDALSLLEISFRGWSPSLSIQKAWMSRTYKKKEEIQRIVFRFHEDITPSVSLSHRFSCVNRLNSFDLG